MTTFFRLLIVTTVLFAMSLRSWAAPCSILRTDHMPCELATGAESPYDGVLMTDSTARDLLDKLFLVQRLEIQLHAEEREHAADNTSHQGVIFKLRTKLEDAPLPFYESPWFWLGVAGAFGGGLALGLSLK